MDDSQDRRMARRWGRMGRALLVALLVAGCASAFEAIAPRETVLKNYTVGEPQTAAVGEPIFDVQRGQITTPVFYVTDTFAPDPIAGTGPGGEHAVFADVPPLQAGMRFEASRRLLKDGSYVLFNPDYHRAWGISVHGDGTVASGWVHTSSGRTISVGEDWPDRPIFRRDERIQEQEGAFRAQMIYIGKEGTTVRATYREFVDNLIRPDFTQPLQFDLAQDSSMAYRSIRVRVLRAETTELEYVVEEDGGLPWLPR